MRTGAKSEKETYDAKTLVTCLHGSELLFLAFHFLISIKFLCDHAVSEIPVQTDFIRYQMELA